jgi:hypothetical protein
LNKLERRRNGEGGERALAHSAEEAGRLIDEYRQKWLLSDDPSEKARCEQRIAELKERM